MTDQIILRELKRLRGERRDLLKKLDDFEREGHTTVGIAFLRRQIKADNP